LRFALLDVINEELMQDNGKGIILAATWILPVLIIPRAWDYPGIEGESHEKNHARETEEGT
jgi:hypothetical protein